MPKSRFSELPQINSHNKYLAVMSAIAVTTSAALALVLLTGYQLQHHSFVSTVTITDSSYMPQALSIKPGTLVTFENLSSAARKIELSVTSPDSKFGSAKMISPNGAYMFTFVKKGTYFFHDSNNVLHNGTITVQ